MWHLVFTLEWISVQSQIKCPTTANTWKIFVKKIVNLKKFVEESKENYFFSCIFFFWTFKLFTMALIFIGLLFHIQEWAWVVSNAIFRLHMGFSRLKSRIKKKITTYIYLNIVQIRHETLVQSFVLNNYWCRKGKIVFYSPPYFQRVGYDDGLVSLLSRQSSGKWTLREMLLTIF